MQQTDLGHKSVRRNPIIADLYHRIGFIEKAGIRIERMREEHGNVGVHSRSLMLKGFSP